MDLTKEELSFLSEHGLSAHDVLDARGMSSDVREQKAKELGKILIIGNKACTRAGHRLRTRKGHCFQCDTSKIAYQKRYSSDGYVYIAGSLRKRLIKIGGTGSIHNREASLNNDSYAGAYDWKILLYVEVKNFGQIEREVQNLLAKYAVQISYKKLVVSGFYKPQWASEVFECSFGVAKNALDQVLDISLIEVGQINTYPFSVDYEFQ